MPGSCGWSCATRRFASGSRRTSPPRRSAGVLQERACMASARYAWAAACGRARARPTALRPVSRGLAAHRLARLARRNSIRQSLNVTGRSSIATWPVSSISTLRESGMGARTRRRPHGYEHVLRAPHDQGGRADLAEARGSRSRGGRSRRRGSPRFPTRAPAPSRCRAQAGGVAHHETQGDMANVRARTTAGPTVGGTIGAEHHRGPAPRAHGPAVEARGSRCRPPTRAPAARPAAGSGSPPRLR